MDLRRRFRALQHHLVVRLSIFLFLVLCSTCIFKCLDDALIYFLLFNFAARVVNAAERAAEEAGALRVAFQKDREYMPRIRAVPLGNC